LNGFTFLRSFVPNQLSCQQSGQMKTIRLLEMLTSEDILQLVKDEVAEGAEIEFKEDLPAKTRGAKDAWHAGGSVGEYARNSIAQEIIAFANSFGGVVVVGIQESDDHPKRAVGIKSLPRVHDLARRLWQAVQEVIDPPLPILEAVGVPTRGGDAGVVVMRVAASRRRPHRHTVSKEAFIRRGDESVRIGMREIQELTIRALSDARRVESTIEQRRDLCVRLASQELYPLGGAGGGVHFIGVPTIPLDLGRVAGRPELTEMEGRVRAILQGHTFQCVWPHKPSDWRTGLRRVTSEVKRKNHLASYTLQTDGTCEFIYVFSHGEQGTRGLFAGWLAAILGQMLFWIERLRSSAGQTAVEYALAPMITVNSIEAILAPFGASNFEEDVGSCKLPCGVHYFDVMSVGGRDEFTAHMSRFDEDVWNTAGQDIQKHLPKFEID